MNPEYHYEHVGDFIGYIIDLAEDYVSKEMEPVYPSREIIGLDMRCGPLFINENAIAVRKHNDGSLQYYGGFEYVDKEYRYEVGDYVFYNGEDERVREHLDRYYTRNEEVA